MDTYIGKTISYPNFVDTKNIKESTDKQNKFRFSLYIPFIRNLVSSGNNLIVIMKNPSSAGSLVCDMTMLKVCNVAFNNGYDGVIVVNLFPMRATNATDIQGFYASYDYKRIMDSNINAIKILATGSNVVFAWGKDTIKGRRQFPTNYDTAVKNMVNSISQVASATYFVDKCKCNKYDCTTCNQGQCHSDIRYPLHGLRWSFNSKLIKY